MLLKIENITKKYGEGTIALDNLSLEVKEGEFLVIIGSSGAGKSTLLRSINKLNRLTSGKVIFQGKEITSLKGKKLREVRREIGMIFQHYNLIERLSVLQNVLHGRIGYMSQIKGFFERYSEADKKIGIGLLNRLGLEKQVYRRADELSGGQMQRVGIARAMAQEPKLMLADEPIASLDPKSSEDVMDYLSKICREENITCMVNLHQVDVAIKYATRIVGMKAGKIVFDGKPEELTQEKIGEIYSNKTNKTTIEEIKIPPVELAS